MAHKDSDAVHVDINANTELEEDQDGRGRGLKAARDFVAGEKVVRYLGVTGHYRPDALMEALHRHDFDCILMALNAADPHHFTFQEQLLPLAVEKQMGIIGMKIPGRGRMLTSYNPPPLEVQKKSWEGMVVATGPGTLTMREAIGYTLSRPVSTVIVGCDSIAQLEENVQIARDFTPYSDTQMAALASKAEPVSKASLFFRFYDHDAV